MVGLVAAVVVVVGAGLLFAVRSPGPQNAGERVRRAGAETISYGVDDTGKADPQRVADLWLPEGSGPHPVAVVIHGGFWRAEYSRDLMDEVSADLARRGWAAWNIEYRRVGSGGGWPQTFEDVAAAVDYLKTLAGSRSLDLGRVVTIGHSAGGHLALWAASRHRIAAGEPGADPAVRPRMAVGQAAVSNLAEAARARVGGTAVPSLLGGMPDAVGERYATASPAELLPTGVALLLVHGRDDDLVPLSQSEGYAAAARGSGDSVDFEIRDGGHFEHLDPDSEMWAAAVSGIGRIR